MSSEVAELIAEVGEAVILPLLRALAGGEGADQAAMHARVATETIAIKKAALAARPK